MSWIVSLSTGRGRIRRTIRRPTRLGVSRGWRDTPNEEDESNHWPRGDLRETEMLRRRREGDIAPVSALGSRQEAPNKQSHDSARIQEDLSIG